MTRSRRKMPAGVTTRTGVTITEVYCRKCMQTRPVKDFYEAVDAGFIDSNGMMSVCKECVNKLFDAVLSAEHSYEKTTLRLCKALNIKYSEEAIQATLKQIETFKLGGKEAPPFFGVYKGKLHATDRSSNRMETSGMNLSYEEVTQINITGNKLEDSEFEQAADLKKFWGTEDKDDIAFLENELANFKQTHACDTYAEIVLLKEVCYRLLEIHKDRQTGSAKDSTIKSLQELMKNLAISPNMANAAGAGKSQDSFGLWIKDIENTSPAEWVKDRSIYKDVDDIEAYGEKFITSPLRAFVTGSREFSIEDGESLGDDDSSEE